jgi:hypothetical protein
MRMQIMVEVPVDQAVPEVVLLVVIVEFVVSTP